MNTNIRFPSSYEKNHIQVIGIVEKLLGGQAGEAEIQNATTAVCDAFHSADSQAGNGMGHRGNGRCMEFYAEADIDNGTFDLYHKITT